ncbi:hypothetical protein PHYC_03023 [Phycisphaerales bacterium]|nr:hypothetical protein PHYC_03023 [Phycisphaerales bacterium]
MNTNNAGHSQRSIAKRVLVSAAIVAAFALTAAGLQACETSKGFGKDMQKLGDKIENKAEEEQND